MRKRGFSRRAFITYIGGSTALAAVAAACRPLAPPAAAPATGESGPAAGQQRRGGTLVVGTITPILSANPYPRNVATGPFWWGLFDTLVRLDERRQPVPHLAEGWTFSDDRRTLTFKLRRDVKFHSGRPVTSEEVKWSVEYYLDPKNGATPAGEIRGVQANALDAATLELKLPGVTPDVFTSLLFMMVIDPLSDVDKAPIGTGPFKLEGLEAGNEIRLVRNPLYWRPDRPFLDGVTIRTVADASALSINLESGAVNVTYCPASEIARLKSQPQFVTAQEVSDGNYCYLANTTQPPFSDRRVRQAVSLAVNRQRFTSAFLYGITEPTYVMWPRTSPAYDASLDTGEFNLDRARQLLVDAGYTDGFETKIQTTSAANPEFYQFNQVFQADLASIGIKATIENLENAQYTNLRAQGTFPALLQHSYAYCDSDPAMAFTGLPFRIDNNVTHFQSDSYTQLIKAAKQEPDWNKRLELYRQITQIVKDEAFVVPVADVVTPYAMRSNVHGFRVLPSQSTYSPVYEDIWLS